eukprot:15442254-Alexandrium_andersonii.AAC.1
MCGVWFRTTVGFVWMRVSRGLRATVVALQCVRLVARLHCMLALCVAVLIQFREGAEEGKDCMQGVLKDMCIHGCPGTSMNDESAH